MEELLNSSSNISKQYSNLKVNSEGISYKVIGMRKMYCGNTMIIGVVEKDDAALFITLDMTLGLLVSRDSESYLSSLENYNEQVVIPEFSEIINLNFNTSNELPEKDFGKLKEIYDSVCMNTAYFRSK